MGVLGKPRLQWRLILIALGITSLLAVGFVWKVVEMDDSPDPRYIGYHPLLYKLRNGQTKAEVVDILGRQPKVVRPRHQREAPWPGPVPADVRNEEWDFEFEGWHGGIMVHFDQHGRVTYIGYGYA